MKRQTKRMLKESINRKKRKQKGKEYHRLLGEVKWYYNNTSLSLEKIGRRFGISYGKAAGMIEGNYPKYYQEYINKSNNK